MRYKFLFKRHFVVKGDFISNSLTIFEKGLLWTELKLFLFTQKK